MTVPNDSSNRTKLKLKGMSENFHSRVVVPQQQARLTVLLPEWLFHFTSPVSLYISAVICSDTSPIRKIVTAAVNMKIVAMDSLAAVEYV